MLSFLLIALVKGLGNIALRQSTGRCTTTVSCDTVMDKGVQPEPINSLGLTPEFVDIDGRSYLNVLPEEGFWDVKSPYYDMGCNYTNNIDAWVFRFTVRHQWRCINLCFWFGGILGSASGAQFSVSLSNHIGFKPRLLYSSPHHSSESYIHPKTG